MMTQAPELKPCPFCGGDGTWSMNQVFCASCEIGSSPNDPLEDAIAAWNRRASAADDLQAAVEALPRYDPDYCDRMGSRSDMIAEPEGDYLLRDHVLAAIRRSSAAPADDALRVKALRMPKLHPRKEYRLVSRTNGVDGYREGWNDAVKAMRCAALEDRT